ncbi:MAG: universal stress protein [Wenzhouxiangella sp.]|nr:universal stress protein [Wenzhouxiangella sp.]
MSKKVLVGIDGSPQGDKAFAFALELARQAGGTLHCCAVVHGAEIEMAEATEREALTNRRREWLSEHLTRLTDDAIDQPHRPVSHLLEGHPVEQLLHLAEREKIDHIVLGHRSKGLFERLLMGSVAKRVVDFARCTVTVVR